MKFVMNSDGHCYTLTKKLEVSDKISGVQQISYSRYFHSGERFDDVMHDYQIAFYDHKTAQQFFIRVKECIAPYAATWESYLRDSLLTYASGTTIKAFNFPVFMAAFTVLASNPDLYGVPKTALAKFRDTAPLGALPDPMLIVPNSDPGTLARKNDGSRHWGMSSVIAIEKPKLQIFGIKMSQGAKPGLGGLLDEDTDFSFKSMASQERDNFSPTAFLEKFSIEPILLKDIRFNDYHIFCGIEFPFDTDLKQLQMISELLNENGFLCHVEKAFHDRILKIGPMIKIEKTKEQLQAWMKAQSAPIHHNSSVETKKIIYYLPMCVIDPGGDAITFSTPNLYPIIQPKPKISEFSMFKSISKEKIYRPLQDHTPADPYGPYAMVLKHK